MKKCSLPFLILRSFPMLAVAATPFKRSSSYYWPCSFFLFFTVSCQWRKNHGCPYLKCNPLWFSYFSSFISIFSCMHPSSLTLILASQPLSHSHLQARLVIQKPPSSQIPSPSKELLQTRWRWIWEWFIDTSSLVQLSSRAFFRYDIH